MSMRLELSDLPPRYRAQAEKQLAQRRCGGKAAPASLEAAVNADTSLTAGASMTTTWELFCPKSRVARS